LAFHIFVLIDGPAAIGGVVRGDAVGPSETHGHPAKVGEAHRMFVDVSAAAFRPTFVLKQR